jgi:hypothetical protein
MHSHPNATVTKFHFGKLFSRAQEQQVTNLSEGMSAKVLKTLKTSIICDNKSVLCQYFHQISTYSLQPNTPDLTSISSPESPMPTGFTTSRAIVLFIYSKTTRNYQKNWNREKVFFKHHQPHIGKRSNIRRVYKVQRRQEVRH